MKIELIKKYTFGAKEKEIGTIAEVTNGLAEVLIKKGIAKEYKDRIEIKEILNKKSNKEEKNVILQNNQNRSSSHPRNTKNSNNQSSWPRATTNPSCSITQMTSKIYRKPYTPRRQENQRFR